jgi:hypothetical protein
LIRILDPDPGRQELPPPPKKEEISCLVLKCRMFSLNGCRLLMVSGSHYIKNKTEKTVLEQIHLKFANLNISHCVIIISLDPGSKMARIRIL